MGKDAETKKLKKQQIRHQPLDQQIREAKDGVVKAPRNKKKVVKNDEDDDSKNFLDPTSTKRVLNLAQKSMQEELAENANDYDIYKKKGTHKFTSSKESDDENDFDIDEREEDYNIEELEGITEEDEKALAMFMSKTSEAKPITLADIIMAKIKEHDMSNSNTTADMSQQIAKTLEPKIIEVYTSVGKLLAHYTSGKLPKAFKIIPSLQNWEEILYLTNPDNWSPSAIERATRIFSVNLNVKKVQSFYTSVLLPRIIDDVREHKKLNFYIYLALKKATFKPPAFFKGIIFPLCEGECSLRLAVIVGSVLSKTSIPVLHSGAAILKISEMSYNGANSYFLAILLNKKYALPYRVIDSLVKHFTDFLNDSRELPVLWHQALLIFAQRYKTDLLPEQKNQIREVIKKHYHQFFSEEIRREFNNSKSRGELSSTEMDTS